MKMVHDALASGQLEGFYSVAMLTIEGIMRQDRADLYAGTQPAMQPMGTYVQSSSVSCSAARS